jgi:hypothetical protein
MREYVSGAVRAVSSAELYFSNENNEFATRSEEEFVIIHSHSLFAAVAPLAASQFKQNFIKPCIWLKQGNSNVRVALTPLKSYVKHHSPYPVQQRRPRALHQWLHVG